MIPIFILAYYLSAQKMALKFIIMYRAMRNFVDKFMRNWEIIKVMAQLKSGFMSKVFEYLPSTLQLSIVSLRAIFFSMG
jgi:hypothetical protein